jgi:outer membrane lipoprotein-sorting protein
MLPLLLLAAPAQAPLPAWWNLFPEVPRLESPFVQESASEVFGALRKQGKLTLAKGGRLRIAYADGLILVADGQRLVQYDPDTRTAQALDLVQAARDYPLLNLLLNPKALSSTYTLRPEGQAVLLRPRAPGLPEVRVEPAGNLPGRLIWTDGSGARQELRLTAPKVPAALPEGTFRFELPAGGRWLGKG